MNWTMAVGILAAALSSGCKVYGDPPQAVTYTVETSVITNEVSEGEYNARTNGAVRTDIVMKAPFNYISVATIANGAWCSTNQLNIYSVGASGPDPFKEKVTVTYFVEERQDVYYVHVGPITEKYGTQWTALSRWKTMHRQKLNMTESVETLREMSSAISTSR